MKDIASVVSDPSTSNSSSSSNSTDEIKEDGCEDPIADVPAIASDEPSETSDVWDDVIAAAVTDDDLDDVDDVDECGANNCATESTSGEIEEIHEIYVPDFLTRQIMYTMYVTMPKQLPQSKKKYKE